MTDYPETTHFVYVSGGATASGRPAGTARPDSLATIIRDCAVLSIAPDILEMQI